MEEFGRRRFAESGRNDWLLVCSLSSLFEVMVSFLATSRLGGELICSSPLRVFDPSPSLGGFNAGVSLNGDLESRLGLNRARLALVGERYDARRCGLRLGLR